MVDGHYYLYVAWDRTGDSGTGKYAIDLTFAGQNVAPDGTPQPLHGEGGVVAYINIAGGGAPTLGQLCAYENQPDYPDDVNSDPGDCTTNTSGFASAIGASGTFFEVGFDLTVLAGITPGLPAHRGRGDRVHALDHRRQRQRQPQGATSRRSR